MSRQMRKLWQSDLGVKDIAGTAADGGLALAAASSRQIMNIEETVVNET